MVKIKYDMTGHYWDFHNEAQSVVMMRKKLMKNPNAKIRNLFFNGIFYGVGIFVVTIFYFLFKYWKMESLFLTVLSNLIFFLVIFLILYYFIIIITYLINNRSASHKGVLVIDEKGLLDSSDSGKEVSISWNHIQFVAMKKYVVTFVTDTKIVIFVPIENKDDILKALQTYQSDLLVVNQLEKN